MNELKDDHIHKLYENCKHDEKYGKFRTPQN